MKSCALAARAAASTRASPNGVSALHRIGVHPAARLDELSAPKRAALVKDARDFSFQFLAWRRENVLRKHLRVHKRKYCADCGTELRRAILGVTERRAFWCDVCQPLPAGADPKRAVGQPFGESWWKTRDAADDTSAKKATKTIVAKKASAKKSIAKKSVAKRPAANKAVAKRATPRSRR